MQLELFTRKGSRSGNPSVTITTAGQISLNSSCVNKYFKDKKYVLLYGDAKKQIIGIKPVDKEQDNSFTISYSIKKTTGSISGNSFLKYLEIDFKTKAKKYIPEWDEKENMLILKLV